MKAMNSTEIYQRSLQMLVILFQSTLQLIIMSCLTLH